MILKELEEMPKSGFSSLFIGVMYAYKGDFDKSFEAWNYENKPAWFPWIRVMFLPDEIKKDPRFLKLIRDMNLPDPAPLVYHSE